MARRSGARAAVRQRHASVVSGGGLTLALVATRGFARPFVTVLIRRRSLDQHATPLAVGDELGLPARPFLGFVGGLVIGCGQAEIGTGGSRDPLAQLIAQQAATHFLHLAFGEFAELKGT